MDGIYMVAKNNAGAQASPESLANASTSDTHPTSPLEFFGEYDEITEHPNELLQQSDELEDMTTPGQTFQWLIEHDFPMKFAQTMRDGKFNGASTLDLFGCASTVKEAGEMFKEFELSMVSLLMIWGNARARMEVADGNRNSKNTEHVNDTAPEDNSGGAQEHAEEQPGGINQADMDYENWETDAEPVNPAMETGNENAQQCEEQEDTTEGSDKLKAEVAKSLRVSDAPKLGTHKENFWSIKDWFRQVSRITSWVGYHSKPMQRAIEAVMTNFANIDAARLRNKLSCADKLKDELLGAHLYNNAPSEYLDHLDLKDDRCIDGAASGIKVIHHITSILLVDADDLKDDLVSKMTNCSGRWQPLRVDQAGSLLKELTQLDKAVLELQGTGACKAEEIDLTWLNAIKRVISIMEDDVKLWSKFGDPLSKFKRDV